jgi:tetratricopeptide (TPR) repeat protein
VGPAGLGVETVLNAWEKADSTDIRMLMGRFRFYLAKGQTTDVVAKHEKRYLGLSPILSLKDSLGREVYYFQETNYDDECFGLAVKTLDKAIALYPDRLDLRAHKANIYITFEKGSPDMALDYLVSLADEGAARKEDWDFDGQKQDVEFFKDAMQEYCRTFYTVGSEASMNVFFSLSKRMWELYPSNVCFLSNVATYHLVAKNDPKTALKHYNKVLRKVKDDQTALRNSYVAASKLGNPKLKEKYRQLLIQYGYIK